MRIKKIRLEAGGAEVTDSIVANTDATANTPLTLEAGAASIDPPKQLLFTFDGDSTAVTFTIVGKNRRGMDQTETLVGVNAGTAMTRGIYSSITSITPDVTDAGTFEIGLPQRTVSPWIIMNTTKTLEQLPYGYIISRTPEDGSTPVAGSIEYTWANVARDGENVDYAVSGSTVSATPGTNQDLPPCAWLRFINEEAAGTVACDLARPTF